MSLESSGKIESWSLAKNVGRRTTCNCYKASSIFEMHAATVEGHLHVIELATIRAQNWPLFRLVTDKSTLLLSSDEAGARGQT